MLAVFAKALLVLTLLTQPSIASQIVHKIEYYNPRVTLDTNLSLRARVRASEIVYDFSHNGFWTRPCVAPYRVCGEVIAWYAGSPTVAATWIIKAWLASPTHRSVLLGTWNGVGASCRYARNAYYCVAEFGVR